MARRRRPTYVQQRSGARSRRRSYYPWWATQRTWTLIGLLVVGIIAIAQALT